ncbi:MAG: M48 family metalloprotease [Gammaproteobacteria bacterium]|nr:M48 family metalloprotease [Gammaproteobacteria bacterium]
MNRMKMINLIKTGLVVLGLSILTGCATNPVTGGTDFVLMSEESEVKLGAQSHESVIKQYTVYHDEALQKLVNDLGQKLAKKSHRSHLDFRFTLLDSPQVNAFALPGGYIYITRGIMAYMNNEEELAGVLGHEIGHVTARHGVRQHSAQTTAGLLGAIATIATGSKGVADLTGQLSSALVRGYGRGHELEADRLGAEYLAITGYDPQKMLGVVGILKDQEQFELQRARDENRPPRVYHGVFSTHPRNDQRLQEVIRAADKFKNPAAKETDPEDFLRYLEGATFGDSEKQGIIHGNRFYHKELDLVIEFPSDWKLDNQPTQLVALREDRQAALTIQIDQPNRNESSAQYLKRKFPKLANGQSINRRSYTGLVDANTPFGQGPVRVASVFHGGRAYVLSLFSKGPLPEQPFFETAKSIRKVKWGEKKLAAEKKITLVRAAKGDTFAKLAKKSNLNQYAEEQLRLLNGMYPDGEPETGQLIKIIK